MKIAITGGTGFIGKKLVEQHLKKGDSVRVLTRKQANKVDFSGSVELYQGDLSDDTSLLGDFTRELDIIYNCAGEVINKDAMHDLHVNGTRRLIEAAAGQTRHWVQLSSVATYGRIASGVVTEESPLKPVGAYGTSKARADELVIEAARRNDFTCSILRPSSVFGPEMTNRSLYSIIAAIKRGYFFFVGKQGANANCVHVDDVVQALMLCGSSCESAERVFNISDCISLEDFAAVVSSELGKPPPRRRIPETPVRAAGALFGMIPGFPLTTSRVEALTTRVIYSCERIKRELGYRQSIPLDAGIADLVETWRQGL